ncbi:MULTISPECIES: ABC transporter ATP-binding protein [unclassified Herbaspirillum]|uniref:ABC transporter ATP-binding protein n=1 Tax=unclassified Herbaspirillum TaxID=2624150 RepID=UPI000E2F803C|nr:MULTISPECIES: ABC transporter ATP-binding protein [unclassified Herbaspirillum]RFB67154.1 ABC transporter ATP-binding protein [Herbaspirillum sp. 3R-3a1]TFI06194.1 ABC transporter ATP-binding protein [Herbaspirillum sp. 3R11]TFI14193.1 ABC transporter ATP-binding protein [Herbaspirillum sp. 3R-11]TFI28840.1 ABC transporter ATP-binding protein [Herbaspirillum sp. 3C11]
MKRDDHAMPQLAAWEQGAADPASAIDAVLSAQRVEKTYRNGTRALDEVKLDIRRGEFVSLLGPSGCGKSTLLKMFAGLEEPSHGHIRWWGKNLATVGTPDHTLAMVFQEATLMPWASVEQNVRLPLDLKHMPRTDSDVRVRDALKLVGLDRFHDAYPRELSGGMQMRASIARALATQPNLLLMDEPFGALDEFTRNKLDADLRKIWSQQDLTVVFVTHSIYEAVYLSSRVVVMAARPGRVIADVPIEAPGAGGMRDDAFRISPEFMGYCKILSDYLTLANQENQGGAHDTAHH